jgi:hypothetical protein
MTLLMRKVSVIICEACEYCYVVVLAAERGDRRSLGTAVRNDLPAGLKHSW